MQHARQVLFDFDGVIADSFALAYDVARITHPEEDLTEEAYRGWFEGNVYESIAKKVKGGVRNDAYFSTFQPRMEKEVRLMPGMREVVAHLATSYPLTIISSTTSALIRSFLERNELSTHFTDVMGSDVHMSKVEKMRMVLEKTAVKATACVFITDTLGDMREAKAHEIGAIAVSWGWHSRERLEQGIPFRIVDIPEELPDAVEDFFARQSDIS